MTFDRAPRLSPCSVVCSLPGAVTAPGVLLLARMPLGPDGSDFVLPSSLVGMASRSGT